MQLAPPVRPVTQARREYSSATSPTSNGSRRWLVGATLAGLTLAAGWSVTSKAPSTPTIQYADTNGMIVAAREIADILGEDAVSFDEDVIEAHGRSDWSTTNSNGRPAAIIYPTSTEQVSQIAKICYKHNVPMVPFGAGSSVEGNFSSPYSGICVDFVRMDKIIAFHPDDMDVVVQPGVNWMDLNRTIRDSKLFLPLDPSPTAYVGGMVATNCSGTNAFRYGTMKDWVINVTVVLPQGEIIKTRRRPRKSSAGYNLTSLFVGAEGTLGFVTEVTLKLAVVPDATSVAVVSFPSIADAARAASALIRSGIQLAALEMMDDVQMRVINRHGSAAVRKRTWDEQPTLFLRFSGTENDVQTAIARTQSAVKPHRANEFYFAANAQEEADLWVARKEALWTMASIKPEGYSLWSTDVAVPVSRLAEMIEETKHDIEQLGLFASVIGHVGDGNFHTTMMYNPGDLQQKAAVGAAVHRMMDRALEMDGTVTGEHGIGMGKLDSLVDELGTSTIHFMQSLKRSVDPKWLMNPGKVFNLPDGSTLQPAKTD